MEYFCSISVSGDRSGQNSICNYIWLIASNT